MFLDAVLGVVVVLPVWLSDTILFREVWIIAYWVVVAAAICSSVELMFVAADVRSSNRLSSFSMSDFLSPSRTWELGVLGKITWYHCQPLRQGSSAKSVRLARGRDGFALQSRLEWLEESLPLWPDLDLKRLPIPSGVVSREGAGLQNHLGGERGHPVVGDGQYLRNQLLLRLLHVDYELVEPQVSLPQYVEAQDDLHARCAFEVSYMTG